MFRIRRFNPLVLPVAVGILIVSIGVIGLVAGLNDSEDTVDGTLPDEVTGLTPETPPLPDGVSVDKIGESRIGIDSEGNDIASFGAVLRNRRTVPVTVTATLSVLDGGTQTPTGAATSTLTLLPGTDCGFGDTVVTSGSGNAGGVDIVVSEVDTPPGIRPADAVFADVTGVADSRLTVNVDNKASGDVKAVAAAIVLDDHGDIIGGWQDKSAEPQTYPSGASEQEFSTGGGNRIDEYDPDAIQVYMWPVV